MEKKCLHRSFQTFLTIIQFMGWIGSPPKDAGVLIPSVHEYGLISKYGLCIWVKIRSLGGPELNLTVFLQKEKFLDREQHSHRENVMWLWRLLLRWCVYKSRNTKGCQQIRWEIGVELTLPHNSWKEWILPMLWSKTSSLQNLWDNALLLLKPLTLWYFLMAGLEIEYNP